MQDEKSAFVQLTTRISTRQSFVAYDKKGKIVAGDPSAVFPVTDLWVFERSMSDSISNRCVVLLHIDVVDP